MDSPTACFSTARNLQRSFRRYLTTTPTQYRRLVRDDPVFWDSFFTTLEFVAIVVSIELVLGFAIALFLYSQLERRRIVLTLILVPMMLAPVALSAAR